MKSLKKKVNVPGRFAILSAALICCVALFWWTFSSLSFVPVPWPDGSAFYLPSIDFLAWPPHWRMHSQAAFVPTYDTANFNMMPLLPSILGVFTRMGLTQWLGAPLAIKMISAFALVLWAFVLWYWMATVLGQKLEKGQALLFASCVGLAGLWDPVSRWGTFVVRSETWIGLYGLFVLREIFNFHSQYETGAKFRSRRLWIISLLLALAAYTHFEAIILVPIVAVGLWRMSEGWKAWLKNLIHIGLRTSLFLLPWGIYVLSHFRLFLDQMDTQFHRLGHGNYWMSNLYLVFHSLFLELGSPIGVPKFFNLGKAIFWLLIFGLTSWTGILFWKTYKNRKQSSEFRLEPVLAAAVGFWASMYLWWTKPEVWFITLCHLFLWPWLGLMVFQGLRKDSPRWINPVWVGGAGAFALISFFATLGHQVKLPSYYTWPVYQEWVGCIEKTIQRSTDKENPKVWQPHVPDILVELSNRQPKWDLTRALDFLPLREQAWSFTQKVDAIVLSRSFTVKLEPHGELPRYVGPERPSDVALFNDEVESPFGPWVIERLPREQPGKWERHVCNIGPFFADVVVRLKQ